MHAFGATPYVVLVFVQFISGIPPVFCCAAFFFFFFFFFFLLLLISWFVLQAFGSKAYARVFKLVSQQERSTAAFARSCHLVACNSHCR